MQLLGFKTSRAILVMKNNITESGSKISQNKPRKKIRFKPTYL